MTAAARPDPAEPFDAFGWALAFILKWEGGYVNDPADHGGATNMGVTQRTLDDARRWPFLAALPSEVRDLSRDAAGKLYRTLYWNVVSGDAIAAISPQMALCCFDCAVQSGPAVAARTFQRVAQAEPDGLIGKVTLSCYRLRRMKTGDRLLLEAFMERRRGFYAAIVLRDPTQRKFSAGWRNRRQALRQLIGLDPEEV